MSGLSETCPSIFSAHQKVFFIVFFWSLFFSFARGGDFFVHKEDSFASSCSNFESEEGSVMSLRRIAASQLFVSQPNPRQFGNGPNVSCNVFVVLCGVFERDFV